MKEFWDERYRAEGYSYGTQPNEFFKETLQKYQPTGKILLPAEGEGRNAIYAAKQGLQVYAFDTSPEGRKKALRLAAQEQVEIDYEVGDFFQLDLVNRQYDVIALIYAHFSPELLSKYHARLATLLKPGGLLILEGFSLGNLELRAADPRIGGPPVPEMLFSVESIGNDFSVLEPVLLREELVQLNEGKYHNGEGKVIRFLGRKP